MSSSFINKLAPELLQKIFDLIVQDPKGSLANSIICCKKWRPIAQSILYTDVFLSPNRLVKFLDNSADERIRSLTIRMEAIPNNPYEPSEAAQTARARLETLERLVPRLKKIGSRLLSFSITVDFPGPFIPTNEIASLMEILPESCTGLEVDIKQTGFIMRQTPAHPPVHLCGKIRAILPQIKYLRVRLPEICPALLGIEQHGEITSYEVVSAPKFQSCLINLAGREPGSTSTDAMATRCSDSATKTSQIGSLDRFPSALPPLVPVLQAFTRLNSHLQQFWVIDVQPRDNNVPHAWPGWIRRDVLSRSSYPIPVGNLLLFFDPLWLARAPKKPSGTEDWIGSMPLLESVAEGNVWTVAATGVRLATATFRGYEIILSALTKAQSEQKEKHYLMLWQNEEAAGEKMLPEGPGPFMKKWNMNEITPSGWTRERWLDAPLVRV